MCTQVAEQQEQRWHAKFALAEFVGHVEKLQEIVYLANSSKLWSIDKTKLKKMVGWGLFIEEVIESLETQSQRDILARALSSLHIATLPRLQQARRWVLGSILGSAFLADHPKPDALCLWIMGEYAKLRASQEFEDVKHKRQPGVLDAFVDDVCGVVKSRGDVGILSHTSSALSLCGGGGRLALMDCDSVASGEGGMRQTEPSIYARSVETAQKRAYASSLYKMLFSDSDNSSGHPEANIPGQRAISFIQELATLARTDILVLEIMCLVLLEPWRRMGFTGKTRTETSSHGPHPASHLDLAQQSSLKSTLLRQVLDFRDDTRLWSFDEWLLQELSSRYEAFAEAYLDRVMLKEA